LKLALRPNLLRNSGGNRAYGSCTGFAGKSTGERSGPYPPVPPSPGRLRVSTRQAACHAPASRRAPRYAGSRAFPVKPRKPINRGARPPPEKRRVPPPAQPHPNTKRSRSGAEGELQKAPTTRKPISRGARPPPEKRRVPPPAQPHPNTKRSRLGGEGELQKAPITRSVAK
jgi:hypothetical protein